jgi:predicted nucleic acid-binding protein
MGRQRIKRHAFLMGVEHIFLDTMFFIYHFEDNERYSRLTTDILNMVEKGQIRCSTSYLTLMELLVKPLKENRQDLVEEYRMIFETFPNLSMIALDKSVAYLAASFCALYNFKPADSIQLASAASAKCDLFLTNDRDLIQIKDLKIYYMDEMVSGG